MELFHFRRQRKLSLRFLASRLLGASIQPDSHDSIVDARTALQLFQACFVGHHGMAACCMPICSH